MRRIGEWLTAAENGLLVLIGDAKARQRVAGATGEAGFDATGLTVAACVAGLSRALGFGHSERVGDLAAALADRDGGDVTLVLHDLDRAADPAGVAGAGARGRPAGPRLP